MSGTLSLPHENHRPKPGRPLPYRTRCGTQGRLAHTLPCLPARLATPLSTHMLEQNPIQSVCSNRPDPALVVPFPVTCWAHSQTG